MYMNIKATDYKTEVTGQPPIVLQPQGLNWPGYLPLQKFLSNKI